MRPPLPFPEQITEFHGCRLPAEGTPAGYSALIAAYGLCVPFPRTLFAIGARHRVTQREGWKFLTPRHAPPATLEGHLTFALKYEGLDLAVLDALFRVVDPGAIESIVRAKPTGGYARRIWFLYEWLTGTVLALSPLNRGSYVAALDPRLQYPGKAVNSPRHRVRNNLPGTRGFCPLVFRTKVLEQHIAQDHPGCARKLLARLPADLRTFAAQILTLGEAIPTAQLASESWDEDAVACRRRAIRQALRAPLSLDELCRLQAIFGDDAGPLPDELRWHDLDGAPAPQVLPALLSAMIAFDRDCASALDPVIAAAILGFGFALARPFDGDCVPLARFLFQRALARERLHADEIMLPLWHAIEERGDEYRRLLEPGGPMDFRFFDATPHAEFVYVCVRESAAELFPATIAYVERFERFQAAAQARIGLPRETAMLLFPFIQENGGRLPARHNDPDFPRLTPDQARHIDECYARSLPPEYSPEQPS